MDRRKGDMRRKEKKDKRKIGDRKIPWDKEP